MCKGGCLCAKCCASSRDAAFAFHGLRSVTREGDWCGVSTGWRDLGDGKRAKTVLAAG